MLLTWQIAADPQSQLEVLPQDGEYLTLFFLLCLDVVDLQDLHTHTHTHTLSAPCSTAGGDSPHLVAHAQPRPLWDGVRLNGRDKDGVANLPASHHVKVQRRVGPSTVLQGTHSSSLTHVLVYTGEQYTQRVRDNSQALLDTTALLLPYHLYDAQSGVQRPSLVQSSLLTHLSLGGGRRLAPPTGHTHSRPPAVALQTSRGMTSSPRGLQSQ